MAIKRESETIFLKKTGRKFSHEHDLNWLECTEAYSAYVSDCKNVTDKLRKETIGDFKNDLIEDNPFKEFINIK